MLALDDPLWKQLDHCYGPASDIPNLIRALASSVEPSSGSEHEPWFSRWSSLCHPGDVYEASYATVPHIVRIAYEACETIDLSFFQLPAAIEVARQRGRGPDVPGVIAEGYHRALADLVECASRHRHEAWNAAMLLSVSAALAVAKGHIDIAEAFLNLDDHMIARINSFDFD